MHFLGIVTTRHLLSPECPDRGQGGQILPSPWSHKGRAQPLKTMGEHQVPCARQHSTATRAELQGPSSGTHRVLWHALRLHADGPCEHTDRANSLPIHFGHVPPDTRQPELQTSSGSQGSWMCPGAHLYSWATTSSRGLGAAGPTCEFWARTGHRQSRGWASLHPSSRDNLLLSSRPWGDPGQAIRCGGASHAGRAAGEAGWGGAQQKISSPSADASDTGPSPG